jgi:hypothetical protein
MESGCAQKAPITEGYRSRFGILKVGDVVDSNSYHMRSIRPNHEFGDSWAFLGDTMKVLEVPKSAWIQGFRSDGPGPPTLYIDEKPYSLEAPSIAANLPPLGCHLQGEGSSTAPSWSKEEEDQGTVAPHGPPPAGCGRRRLSHMGRRIYIIFYNTSSSSTL